MLGRWYHTVMAYDSATGEVQFYIDGELDSEPKYLRSNPVRLGLGGGLTFGTWVASGWGSLNDGRFLAGALDDIRIYDYVITPEKARELYAMGEEELRDGVQETRDGQKAQE